MLYKSIRIDPYWILFEFQLEAELDMVNVAQTRVMPQQLSLRAFEDQGRCPSSSREEYPKADGDVPLVQGHSNRALQYVLPIGAFQPVSSNRALQ